MARKDSDQSKLWGGRFDEPTDPTVERFTTSVHFDRALAHYDIRGSLAHVAMLAHAEIIPEGDARLIEEGLEKIAAEIEAGTFQFDPALEDIHMNIEARLGELAGPAAGRLHTGRSRNDQVATDLALYLRDATLAARHGLLQMRLVLLERAYEHIDTLLPGYTHLQRAQPVRLAHHWLAFATMLGRDAGRFKDASERLTASPLGSGALAGSTLSLDREHTAKSLGFAEPSSNSIDSVASRDGALEWLSAAAITLVHLSRLAEELVLWSTAEFGFVELSDAYATGSSLMPQKKNPDVPELVRGKAGRGIGNLVALLTTMKGLPLAYNRDLQEDKEPIFDSAQTLGSCLEVLSGAMGTLGVNVARMREAAEDPLLLATDLAEVLVREGVAFREAHEAVGRLVGHCTREGINLRELSQEQLAEFHAAFPGSGAALLDLEASVEARGLRGGTARARVEAELANLAGELAREAETLEASAS